MITETPLRSLPTPCLLIEHSRLERNLRSMQERADREGVALRPHIKTHKSTAIARRQDQLGARGLTCATPAEAELLVECGFDDVRLAYPIVGRAKLERLARLRSRARITFCVENREAAEDASRLFEERGDAPVEVLLEVDTGYGRTGVPWEGEEAVDLARRLTDLPGLRLVGLLTHAGESYQGPGEGESADAALERASALESDRLLALAGRLQAAGLVDRDHFEISVGSTPTASRFRQRRAGDLVITELRPGNYVFNDLTQVSLGAAHLDDCALTALATVTSRRRDARGERAVLDAGKKTLTADKRYGHEDFGRVLLDTVCRPGARMEPLAGASLHALSEEHGWLRLSDGADLALGALVRVVPNHACVSNHTQDRVFLVDGDRVIAHIEVDARADRQGTTGEALPPWPPT